MPRLKRHDALLGANAAARHLDIHRSTLTYWRRIGALKPTAVAQGPRGPRYLYSQSDLNAFDEQIERD